MCMQYIVENELTLPWFKETLGKMGLEIIIQIIDDQRQKKLNVPSTHGQRRKKPVIIDKFSIYRERKERYEPYHSKSHYQIKDLDVRNWFIHKTKMHFDSYRSRNGKLICL